MEPRRLHQRNNWGLCQVGWVETSSLVVFFRFFLCSWVFEAISCYFCMLGIVKQQFFLLNGGGDFLKLMLMEEIQGPDAKHHPSIPGTFGTNGSMVTEVPPSWRVGLSVQEILD